MAEDYQHDQQEQARLRALSEHIARTAKQLDRAVQIHRLGTRRDAESASLLDHWPDLSTEGHEGARVHRTSDQGGTASTCQAQCSCGWAGTVQDEMADGTYDRAILELLDHTGRDLDADLAAARAAAARISR